MNRNRIPDWLLRDVCQITPEWLDAQGVRAILTDLDNTLAGYRDISPAAPVAAWLKSVQEAKIPLMVLSNNNEHRVAAFCGPLGLPCRSKCGKPRPDSLLHALEAWQMPPEQAIMVGDQIRTDIRAGKRAGMRVVLIDPYNNNLFFRLRRWIELRHYRTARRKEANP